MRAPAIIGGAAVGGRRFGIGLIFVLHWYLLPWHRARLLAG